MVTLQDDICLPRAAGRNFGVEVKLGDMLTFGPSVSSSNKMEIRAKKGRKIELKESAVLPFPVKCLAKFD